MNVDYFRTLYQYNYATHQMLWDSTFTLTDAQFTQESGYSIGSIRNHLVHLTSADQRWLRRLKGEPLGEHLIYDQYVTAASIYPLWQVVKTDMLAYVDSLDDAALERVVEYDLPHRGGIKRDSVWQILAHIVNHGTDHRAQVLALLDSFGAPTFEQDLMIYLWTR